MEQRTRFDWEYTLKGNQKLEVAGEAVNTRMDCDKGLTLSD